MVDHTEIRKHVGKDSKLFVVTGAISHDWLISKVWSCWSWHCKYGHACILLLQSAAVVFIRNIWCSFAVMGSNCGFSLCYKCDKNVLIFLPKLVTLTRSGVSTAKMNRPWANMPWPWRTSLTTTGQKNMKEKAASNGAAGANSSVF